MQDNPTRRRRVLVTGASGRVGRHVVEALAGEHEVTVLDLAPPVRDVPFVEGNVLDLERVRTAMAGQDANTLVQLPGRPNVPADVEPVSDGLDVRGQNYEGSLAHDRGTWVGWLHRFLPVGFYYKAFYKPRGAWRFWAPFIRRKAGLGRVDEAAPRGYFDKAYLFSDVIVIGGGPAGMSAAIIAAKAGAEVILVDENPILGGALNYARFDPMTA